MSSQVEAGLRWGFHVVGNLVKLRSAALYQRAVIAALASLLMISGASTICASPFSFDAITSTPVSRHYTCKAGPWGELDVTRIALEPPPEYLQTDTTGTLETGTWVFRDFSRRQVADVFSSAQLSPPELDYIMNRAKWMEGPGAVVVFPDREFILGMKVDARRSIYSVLARFEENPAQTELFTFRSHTLEDQFYKSGVPEETIARFKKLLYPQGNLLLFADAGPFTCTLPTAEEKRRFHGAIARKMTLLVKLKVSTDSDIEALDDYWDYSGRPKELRPLFESLARVPEGTRIDVVHLLPGFARKRIYTFPRPNDSNPIDHNCHWTAFNFFNDPPDERLCDIPFISQTAATQYDKVTADPRFGDVVVLSDVNGSAIHSAVWIADGIVFTKNGSGFGQPFLYSHLKDVLDDYMATSPPGRQFQVIIYRKKALAKSN